jgi:hypothetical protein
MSAVVVLWTLDVGVVGFARGLPSFGLFAIDSGPWLLMLQSRDLQLVMPQGF